MASDAETLICNRELVRKILNFFASLGLLKNVGMDSYEFTEKGKELGEREAAMEALKEDK
jgi:hypothetical protein